LDFLFSPSSFNFNFDESVTYMPGTFCYRHARPHKGDTSTALEAAEGTRTSKH
jgi:hypothetical protein